MACVTIYMATPVDKDTLDVENPVVLAYDPDKCMARIWGDKEMFGKGLQCSRCPNNDSDYCKIHRKQSINPELHFRKGCFGKPALGRVDEPYPLYKNSMTDKAFEWAITDGNSPDGCLCHWKN